MKRQYKANEKKIMKRMKMKGIILQQYNGTRVNKRDNKDIIKNIIIETNRFNIRLTKFRLTKFMFIQIFAILS